MFKPKSLYDSYHLARIQEAAKAVINKRYTSILPTPKQHVANTYANKNTTYGTKPQTHLALLEIPYNKSPAPVNPQPKRQLSQKVYEEKRYKNLCFYCDQKYIQGHKCSGQLFALEVLADEEVSEELEE